MLATRFLMVLVLPLCTATAFAAERVTEEKPHPDSTTASWSNLFESDLSNAEEALEAWSFKEGVLAASEDQVLWTNQDYENFTLDLEFKNATGTNSGVIVYATDMKNWVPNSVEVQIADDYYKTWAEAPKTWQCAAIFGHLAPVESRVKPTGEWNRLSITCLGPIIHVALNGKLVTKMDMRLWRSGTTNPDGTPIPEWLNRPFSELATKGRIGLQGKHGDAPIYFRNIRIKVHKSPTHPSSVERKLPAE